jgi:site-specific recombinase XerD
VEQRIVAVEISAITPIDAARTRAYIDAATAPNTRRAYRSDWEHFARWCAAHGFLSLPATPETVALYLGALASVAKVSTVQRRLTAIAKAHRAAGHETPTKSEVVHLTMRGIRRTHGVAPTQKAPAVLADLRAMLAVLPDNLIGTRDRAILLLGFAGAFRRSELVALDVGDLGFGERGLTITLRRSKGDQEGEGVKKGIPFGRHGLTCPVTATRDYMDMSRVTGGPLFRSVNRHGQIGEDRLGDKAVALVVKRAALAAGLDPTKYAGHSLRAGLATSAAAGGAQERDIMRQTGHRSVQMLRRYIRDGELFRDNAAASAGL